MIPVPDRYWTGDALDTAVLKRILDESKARIVFNTTHNRYLYKKENSPGLLERFNENGLKDYIHPSLKTDFPDGTDRRIEAIEKWLDSNIVDKWCCFDDNTFMVYKNVIML